MIDSYGSMMRERMKYSMSEPAKGTEEFKRLNVREAKSYIPLPKLERRRRYIYRFWFNHNRIIGQFLYSIVFVIISAEVIFLYGNR